MVKCHIQDKTLVLEYYIYKSTFYVFMWKASSVGPHMAGGTAKNQTGVRIYQKTITNILPV